MIQPRIEILAEKKMIGKSMRMSFADNRTADLWRSFMQRRREITNAISNDLFSMEVYEAGFFDHFDMAKPFTKWAVVEVPDFDIVPEGLETVIVPSGLYAVFDYRGPASEGHKLYQYIFAEWLPASQYTVDYRPHFAWMGEKYKGESPDSEEEIWIPVQRHKEIA